MAIIGRETRRTQIHALGVAKGDAVFILVGRVFFWVEFKLHQFL